MERKNKEKSKTHKIITNLNITSTKYKKDQNEDILLQLKSNKLDYLEDFKFEEKIKILFDSKKFSIGNQFDQKGSEKFLAEKDECLKCMDLDYTILEKKNSNKFERKRKNKSKTQKGNLIHNLKYIPQIEINNENIESFFSTESSKQIFKEIIPISLKKNKTILDTKTTINL